jgi:hypothetical protein
MPEGVAFWIDHDVTYRIEVRRQALAFKCPHCKGVVWREPPDDGGTFWFWCDCTTIAVPHLQQTPGTKQQWRFLVTQARSMAARIRSTRGIAFGW